LKVQDSTDPTRFLQVYLYIHRVSEELVVSYLRVAKEGGTIWLTRLLHYHYVFLLPDNLSLFWFICLFPHLFSQFTLYYSFRSFFHQLMTSFSFFLYSYLLLSLSFLPFVIFQPYFLFFLLFSFKASVTSSVHCARVAGVGAHYECECTYGYCKIKNLPLLDSSGKLNPNVNEGSNTLHISCPSALSVEGNV